jgi:hypothetical protein
VFSESCPLPTGALLDAKDPDTARVEGLSGDPATRWRHQEEQRDAHTRGRPETTGRMLSVVAGTRSDRLHTDLRRLVVQMQFMIGRKYRSAFRNHRSCQDGPRGEGGARRVR